MFEDILGKPNPIDKLARDLFEANKNTVIVCPECGVEMMSCTVNDEDEIILKDCDFPCRQCSEDPTEVLKWYCGFTGRYTI